MQDKGYQEKLKKNYDSVLLIQDVQKEYFYLT